MPSVTLHLAPVPECYAEIYRRRGIAVPERNSGNEVAALVPYNLRGYHHRYAVALGFFWIPCPLCTEPFGGHEIGDMIPDPTRGERFGLMICPACSAERNGGVV